MSLFDIWSEFGFVANPYSHLELRANEDGDDLMVGRERESRYLAGLIGSDGAHAMVEGPIGVGKTSLIQVTGFRMRHECLSARSGVLFLPAELPINASEDTDKLESNAYQMIAQTLIRYVDDFERAGLFRPDIDALDQWLNAPKYKNRQMGVGGFGFSANVGGGGEPNTSEGFASSGFPLAIRAVLADAFRDQRGGIICTLDNMELLKTTAHARASLDALRDRLFNLPNVRWVLGGSRSILTHARTQRLSGVFHAPLRLQPLSRAASAQAVKQRIKAFGGDNPRPPVTPETFGWLYEILGQNLRETLTYCESYSHWLFNQYLVPGAAIPSHRLPKDEVLEDWLYGEAALAFGDASESVEREVWKLFFRMCELPPDRAIDWRALDYSSQDEFDSLTETLVSTNLVARQAHPDDVERWVCVVTSQGYLINYFKRRFFGRVPN